jgi:hypothetical protein
MNAQENAVKKPLWEERPELFDGYDGTERNDEQQQQHADYCAEMMKTMPDYIKQAVVDHQHQLPSDADKQSTDQPA